MDIWKYCSTNSFNSDIKKLGDYFNINNSINKEENKPLEIDKVIFNEPATIVLWKDGTKTIVKEQNEPFDPEKGLAMAISKKALGNKGNYYNEFRKWLFPYTQKQIDEVVETLSFIKEWTNI